MTDWALVTQQEEERRRTTRIPTGAETQCAGCGLFFSSDYPFVKHQNWVGDILVCLPPEAVGLQKRIRKAGETWVSDSDPRAWTAERAAEGPHSSDSGASGTTSGTPGPGSGHRLLWPWHQKEGESNG